MKQMKNVFYYLILSIVAALLLLVLAFFGSSSVATVDIFDKLIVSAVFIITCIFGISLAIHPGWFKRFKNHEMPSKNEKHDQKTTRKRKGHHPECVGFQSHTIKIKNKILCAGCTGLAIGSIISILLTIIYLAIAFNQPLAIFRLLLLIGLSLIGLVFIEIMLPIRSSIIHVISNIILVISFFIIAICILEITGNKIYGMIGVLLSTLFLDTRIRISNWRHVSICNNCTETCKMF